MSRPPTRRWRRRPIASRWAWLRDAPGKVKATVGFIAALLPILAFLGIRGLGDGGSSVDRIEIGEPRLEADTLAVDGTYADLLPDSETVVVLLRLSDGDDARWTTVEADREPADGEQGDESPEAEDGRWEAAIPVLEEGVYQVTAAIIPARSGGGFSSSVLDQLGESGAEASIVEDASSTVTVGN